MKRLSKLLSIRRRFVCPVCGKKLFKFRMLGVDFLRQFEASQFPHSMFTFETLNVLGYSCPSCGACDRARLYKLYFDRYFRDAGSEKLELLDIAPDPKLAPFLKSRPQVVYRSADIIGVGVDDKVDITDMALYEDNRFDFILCSHVLEHVPDDRKAMRELLRVLRPGGRAIVMAPIMLTIDVTDEDPGATPEERMKRFGQDDHIRLYSKADFVSRLRESGFVVSELGVGFFGAEAFERHGITERSVLYLVEKGTRSAA